MLFFHDNSKNSLFARGHGTGAVLVYSIGIRVGYFFSLFLFLSCSQLVFILILIIEFGFHFVLFSPYLGPGPEWEFQFKSMPDSGVKVKHF